MIDDVLREKLEAWKGRPDFLGFWLDLALDQSGSSAWTDVVLIQRWRREASGEKVRFWIERAEELGLLVPTEDGRGWKLHLEPAADPEIREDEGDAQAGSTKQAKDEMIDELAERISEIMLLRLPALSSLASLEKRSTAVRLAGDRLIFGEGDLATAEEVERAYFVHVLEEVEGNRSRAAEVLGVDASTLYRKLSRWGIR